MNFDRVLETLLSSPASAGLAGALGGALLTSKSGRRLGKKALEIGGMAALAGVAYAAWQRHQRGATASEPTDPSIQQLRTSGFLPISAQSRTSDDLGIALFRAMVAAARADGRLDAGERQALLEQIGKLGLREAERAELYSEIEREVTLEEVVDSATTPERAIEVYTASRLAIEPDSPAERGYLTLLAARLELDDGLVAEIERGVREASAAAVVSRTHAVGES